MAEGNQGRILKTSMLFVKWRAVNNSLLILTFFLEGGK